MVAAGFTPAKRNARIWSRKLRLAATREKRVRGVKKIREDGRRKKEDEKATKIW